MDKIWVIYAVLAAIALLYIIWCLAEPFFLDNDRAVLKKSDKKAVSEGKVSITKLPQAEPSREKPDLRIFFFSDIHAEWCPVTSKRICNAIRRANEAAPLDAVIFGGDLITYPHNAARGYKYLNSISSCCRELGIPFYGISGNHDTRLPDAPERSGFISLDNRTLTLVSVTSGRGAILAGLPDSETLKRGNPKMPATDGTDPVILVVHDPDTLINLASDDRPDFMLSGHLHGGQMKFPFRIEFRILRKKDKVPNMGAVQGVFNIDGTTVFISRGLGCGLMPFRFLSVPEATVVEICL